ncbi:serine hydrolase domain-containing protein [Streptomyces phaeofaciens JCM 4814]|uniref:D-alanyl-D-alanine carboxypeptidase n=1 Tax=Streptomyces phaeofaciens TaxID=68254 RepID=A0A918H1J1_9ACTN|nr:D-alanyl-D-alanine carboxypeptidase [Streptomyces phaeofaciens]
MPEARTTAARRTARRTGAVAAAAAGLMAATTALAGPATASPEGAAGDAPPAPHAATRQAMDAQVTAGVPGVTGQVADAHGVWIGTAGVADLGTGRPRGGQDRYRIGSITKTFVSTVLLQLQAEGRIDLDDSVDEWLPGLVEGNGHDGGRITVRQLLNHTSGVYNYTADPGFQQTVFGPGFLEHRYDTWSPRRLVRLAMTHAPDFPPGTDWSYSNTNYVLAGLVVESVTGRPYGEEVRRRIIGPLGLRSTGVPGTDSRMPRPGGRAYSKLSEESTGTTYDVTELNPSIAWAAGEMISSSADLNRFTSALLSGRLLTPAGLREMTATIPAGEQPPGSATYGLGLMRLKLSCGKEVWGHTGGIHGSLSGAVTTKNGRHSLAFNLNGDWTGDPIALMEAEYCGTTATAREEGSAERPMPLL